MARKGKTEMNGLRREMEKEVEKRVRKEKEIAMRENGIEWEKKIESVAKELVSVREEKSDVMEKMANRLKVEVELAIRKGDKAGFERAQGRIRDCEGEVGELKRNLGDCKDNLCCMVERHETMVKNISNALGEIEEDENEVGGWFRQGVQKSSPGVS